MMPQLKCSQRMPAQANKPSFSELMRMFGHIGIISFGGPAGQIALMHRLLVEERKWLDDKRFIHALNYCMILPGPEAMQLATYIGWLLHGVRGGLIAGLLFLVPGAVLVTVLSAIYMNFGEVQLVQGILFGLKAAVLAAILDALNKIARRSLSNKLMYSIAAISFFAATFLKLPFPLIILFAALAGFVASCFRQSDAAPSDHILTRYEDTSKASLFLFLRTCAIWLAVWLLPLIVLLAIFGREHVFFQAGAFFSAMAAVTFGGAYAVLAWVAQQAVEFYGWLQPDEMLTGLGLAEVTPGPLILVLVFVGFLGSARFSGYEPLIGGLAGACIVLWFTFAASFLFIFAGAPYIETLRNIQWLSAALNAVTAAIVGVIASLAMWFGLHVLFSDIGERAFGGFIFAVPNIESLDIAAALIAFTAWLALILLRANLLLVLLIAALTSAAMSFLI